MSSPQPKSSFRSKDTVILVIVVTTALILHVMAILLVKDMEVSFSGVSHGGLQRAHDEEAGTADEDKIDEEEELAALFNQMMEETAPMAEEELEEEVVEEDILQPMPLDDMAPLTVDLNTELPDMASEELSFEALCDPILETPDVNLELPTVSGDAFVNQIVASTDLMQGYAQGESSDNNLDAIQAGTQTQLPRNLNPQAMDASSAAAAMGRRKGGVGSIASSQDFNLKVSYAPKRNGSGYVFRLELAPKPNVRFRRISHNMSFVLDRSASIDRERYQLSKDAVAKALDLLDGEDSFNILVFDKKVVRMSPENLQATPENRERGRAFLQAQKHGGLFASTELYGSLDKIIPQAVADTEVNTAVLFSDGDTFLKQIEQRRSIGSWTQRNGGKVSLFSLAAGAKNNLALLELISHFNKGWMLHAPTNGDIEAQVYRLVKAIRNPIGKEIVATAVAEAPGAKIKLYPDKQRLPELYEDIPYVIYGTCEKLSDFHVFLQGKYYNRWLDIKHKVSFQQATKPTENIEKALAQHRAFELYNRYLADGESRHVRQANSLLTPHQLKPAFR